ncbi:MAG: SDR family NAD-dependent epimerase/dehydratase, partial [Candidatus Aenigmatarchaeota archaeon]
QVVCVDSLITGEKGNIEGLMGNENFRFIQHDIAKLLEIKGMEYVFLASPVDYYKFPLETMLVNSLGTLNMLELARKQDAKFLLASTSEVYGDPEEHPQREDYWGNVNPVGKRSCYDESKRFAEALSMVYFRKYGVGVKIARIFNTYGPRMRKDDGRAVPNFITQALQGKDITVYGDGNQTRSFCYVSDMVEGIETVMFKAKAGDVFNLGNPEEFKIIEFARLVKELTGSESNIAFMNLPEDDPKKRRPDITKAKKLGWEPKTDIKTGLEKTIEWFRKNL